MGLLAALHFFSDLTQTLIVFFFVVFFLLLNGLCAAFFRLKKWISE